MPTYRFSYNGQPFEVEAENKIRAISKARLRAAMEQQVQKVQGGAKARSEVGLDNPQSPEFRALREEGERRGTAAAAGPSAAILGSAVLGPLIGESLGAATAATRALPIVGKATQLATSRPGVAAIAGAEEAVRTGDPIEAAKGAALGWLLGRGRGPVSRAVNVARQAQEAAAVEAPAAAAAPAAVTGARTVAAEADDIVAAAMKMRAEHKLSGAQIVSALKQSYGVSPKDGRKLVQGILDAEKSAASPLRVPRIEQGAQKVGRAAGMTKEEVRVATGPVLGEAVGEASPVLPKKALQSIIDTMKAMPMAEREAYVAKATSGKAQWQIENIRRTLEHLGLLLPAGVAAGAAMAEGGS